MGCQPARKETHVTKLIWLLVTALGGAGLVRLLERWRKSRAGRRSSGEGVLSSSGSSGAHSADDAALVSLLQEEIGRGFTQPTAIRISARDGIVILNGSVLAAEHERLLAQVRAFRGVRAVQDQLQPRRQRGDLPDIHTSADRHDDDGI